MHHRISQNLTKVKFHKTGSNQKIYDLICENPHIKSRGAYLLLRRKLKNEENVNVIEELERWLDFRHEFLKKELAEKGVLKCNYCPRKDLVIGHRKNHHKNRFIDNLATVDHVTPLSKGGDKYDIDNMVVSCRCCNRHKGDSDPTEFEVIGKTMIFKSMKEFTFSIEQR